MAKDKHSAQQSASLEKILHGELVFYYPLVFDEEIDATKIPKSTVTADHYHAAHQNVVKQNLMDVFKNYPAIKATLHFPANCASRNTRRYPGKCQMPKMLKVILTPTDKSVSFAIKADYEEIIDKERQRSAVCENQMTEIYGRKFVRSQDRFLLAPIQATLNNEESIWITAQLILFSNKMAVLRIKFPLINVGIQPLLDNNYDEYISTLNSDLDIRKNRFSLNEVINFYLEHLHNDCGIGITLHDFPITHIVIVDYPENRRPGVRTISWTAPTPPSPRCGGTRRGSATPASA